MAEGNSIKDEVKEQRKKFLTLTFTGKLQYIWEYYRIPIAAVIAVVLVVLSFINAYRRNNYEGVCDIAVCDGKITGYDTDDDVLTTGFTKYLGIDGKKQRVHIDYSYTLEEKLFDQDPQISNEKIYVLSQTNNLDGYMSEYENIDHFCFDTSCFFYDLTELFTDEEMEQLSDYIIYHTQRDGETRAVAVDLSDAPRIQDTDLTMERPCHPRYMDADDAVAAQGDLLRIDDDFDLIHELFCIAINGVTAFFEDGLVVIEHVLEAEERRVRIGQAVVPVGVDVGGSSPSSPTFCFRRK